MRKPNLKREWIETFALVSLSLFLYKVGLLFFLFLVPLQVIYEKRGLKQLLYSCAVFIGASILFALSSISRLETRDVSGILFLLEIGIPGLFILGIVLVNSTVFPWKRNLYKLLGSVGAAALISIPLILYVSRNEGFTSFFNNQFRQMMNLFNLQVTGEGSFEASVMDRMFQTEEFLAFLRDMVFKNYVFIFFTILSANWWLGSSIVRRYRGLARFSVVTFRNPDIFIWPLLISWALVLVDTVAGIGPLSYLFWNSALICLFLFGLQGVGIVKHLFARYHVPRGLRLLLSFILIIVTFLPGVNIVVFIGIPGLGVSELWIKYRKLERS